MILNFFPDILLIWHSTFRLLYSFHKWNLHWCKLHRKSDRLYITDVRGFIWDEPELTEDLSVLKDEGRDKSNIQLHLYESIFPFMRGSDEGWTAFISSIEAMFKDFPLTSFQVAIVNCSIVSFEQKWIDLAEDKRHSCSIKSAEVKSFVSFLRTKGLFLLFVVHC